MSDINQSLRQASVRAFTGTTADYNGDWLALFDLHGIAAGTFNERMLAWLNANLGNVYTDLPGAEAAFAAANGVTRWQDLGTFTVRTNTQTAAALSRFGTAVSASWASAIDALFTALKAGAVSGTNLLTKLDVLVIPAHAANNWINIVQNAFNPSVGAGTPVFENGGYTTNGTDSWVSTNFNPATAGGHLSQNSAHYRVKCSAKAAAANALFGWFDGTDGVTLNTRDASADYSFRVHQAALSTFATTSDGITDTLINRSGASATQLYTAGTAQTVGTNPNQASTAPNSVNLRIGSVTAAIFAAMSMTDYSIGSSLTANEVTDLTNALATLRAATGHP